MTAPVRVPGVEWILGDPPARVTAPPMRHDLIAEALRGRPGVWAILRDAPVMGCTAIAGGVLAPYRPGGSFEATSRGGVLYVRYVGGDVR